MLKKLVIRITHRLFCRDNTESIFKSIYCKFCASDLILQEVEHIHPAGDLFIGSGSRLMCWGTYTSGREYQQLNPYLSIGDNFHATRNLTIQCAGKTTIGKDVLVASDVFIIDYNHGMDPAAASYLENLLEVSEVSIGDGVWIGNNVIILPGVHIGKKSIIGAGSVVTKDIPDYSIAVGNPARVIKHYDIDKREWRGLNNSSNGEFHK